MRVNSENEEKASVSSAGFAAQRAVSALVVSALFFVNGGFSNLGSAGSGCCLAPLRGQ